MQKISLLRRIAACAVALGVAGSLALATPVAAQDSRDPASAKDQIKMLCEVFGGILHDFGDNNFIVCQFESASIVCDSKGCWVALPMEAPPLKDECDSAGGRYGELGPTTFSCEIKEGVLAFYCEGDREWTCAVGWADANEDGKGPE